jgi:hypothetical protein
MEGVSTQSHCFLKWAITKATQPLLNKKKNKNSTGKENEKAEEKGRRT